MEHEWQNEEYSGLERRQSDRRQLPDRRSEIRWEPVKRERRTGVDRREMARGVQLPSIESDNG